MEIDHPLHFSTKDDEVRYWMNIAHQMYERKEDVERELIEYQENSMILERELETSFEQTNKRNKQLFKQNSKLISDNEELKIRLNEQVRVCSDLENQLQSIKRRSDDLMTYVRKLEQDNDDLERINREAKGAEEDLEFQYNQVIEKLALLETELDEKESLKVMVQRLKDENIDLKQQSLFACRQQANKQTDPSECVTFRNSFKLRNSFRRRSVQSTIGVFSDEHKQTDKQNNSLLSYVRELEAKIKALEKAQSIQKAAEDEREIKFKVAIEKINSLEAQLAEKENYQNSIQQCSNTDYAEEVEMRFQNENAGERIRSHSHTNNEVKEEKQRSSTLTRMSRYIDSRAKKVKEEEKRQQNLMWFLKRLRYPQPNWLRKKE